MWVYQMEANVNLDEWKGKDAKPSKDMLNKPMVVIAKRDFPKQAKTKDGKPYTATYHILYVILDENGEKMKVFASDNLNKVIEQKKDKLPLHGHIEFVPNAGKYGKGFYKFVLEEKTATKATPQEPKSQ